MVGSTAKVNILLDYRQEQHRNVLHNMYVQNLHGYPTLFM